jgi:hypothetical protein
MSENDSNDTTSVTVAKTLWSETLIDLLIVSLQKGQTDAQVSELLKELKEKNFKSDYIVKKINKNCGEEDAVRVKQLLRNL